MKKLLVAALLAVSLAGCTGDMGPAGPAGPQGEQGQSGPPGGSGTGFVRFYGYSNESALASDDVVVSLPGWTDYDKTTEWWTFSAFVSVAYAGDDGSRTQIIELPAVIHNAAGSPIVADAAFLPLEGKVRFYNLRGGFVIATVAVFRRPDRP